ncbi:MAG: hypothetical protein R2822_21165 [Spirosomataceae bacterium]
MKSFYCLLVGGTITLFSQKAVLAQQPLLFDNTPSYAIKFSGYFLIEGGITLSAGIGYWKRFSWCQPGTNLSFNYVFGKKNLGNREQKGTKWQLNTVVSPMLTFNLSGNRMAVYEEINPFYLGNSGAVYANYRSSATIGSSFVVTPKGLGKNIGTARNRSQQLVFVQIRAGWNQINSATLSLYEDFLFTDNGAFQGWADNWDRFYTGGGNLQVRVSEQVKLKLYSEIYTGFAYRDVFDYPDLIEYSDDDTTKRYRYAYQDPGQQKYNVGRTLFAIDYTPSQPFFGGIETPNDIFHRLNTYQLYIGRQGGDDMWSQNAIHSLSKINVIREDRNPKGFHVGCKDCEHLHFFKPDHSRKNNKIIGGIGTEFNFQ